MRLKEVELIINRDDSGYYLIDDFVTTHERNINVGKGDLFYNTERNYIVVAEYSPYSKISRAVVADATEIGYYRDVYANIPLQLITQQTLDNIIKKGGRCAIEVYDEADVPAQITDSRSVQLWKAKNVGKPITHQGRVIIHVIKVPC